MITTTTTVATAAAPTFGTEKAASSSDGLDKSSSSPSSNASAVWEEYEWAEEDERRSAQLLCANNDDDDDERHLNYDNGQPQNNAVRIVDDTVAWDRFYRQHQTRFFKDRHYLLDTFPDEFRCRTAPPPPRGGGCDGGTTTTTTTTTSKTLVEFGCGVGNAVWPVLELGWTVIGVDLSATAIALFQVDERFMRARERAQAYVMDITCSSTYAISSPSRPTGGPDNNDDENVRRLLYQTADVATLLFCLSAIPPDRQIHAVRNVLAALRPGGVVIVRDYGRYDQAQFQLHQRRRSQQQQQQQHSNNQCLVDHFYQKQDGTKVYYFTTDDLLRLFDGGGDNDNNGNSMTTTLMEVLECRYLRRVYRNRATGTTRRRVWPIEIHNKNEGLGGILETSFLLAPNKNENVSVSTIFLRFAFFKNQPQCLLRHMFCHGFQMRKLAILGCVILE
jgi:methyltransferase-like protein 6